MTADALAAGAAQAPAAAAAEVQPAADPNARVAGGAQLQVLTVDEVFDRIEDEFGSGQL